MIYMITCIPITSLYAMVNGKYQKQKKGKRKEKDASF